MPELTLHVIGMRCRDCVREVTARLRDVPGVLTVTADHTSAVVRLSGSMSQESVAAALEGSPFRIGQLAPDSSQTEGRQPRS